MPSAIGIRTRCVLATSDSCRDARTFGSDHDGHPCRRSRSSLMASASGDGVNAQTTKPHAARRRSSSGSSVVRAAGKPMAWPIETRSERRDSGSALVWSKIDAVPAECDRVAHDRSDVDRDCRRPRSRPDASSARASAPAEIRGRSLEESDDALRDAELGDHRADLIAARVDRHVVRHTFHNAGRLGGIDEHCDRRRIRRRARAPRRDHLRP